MLFSATSGIKIITLFALLPLIWLWLPTPFTDSQGGIQNRQVIDYGELEAPLPGLLTRSICRLARGGLLPYLNIIVRFIIGLIIAVGLVMIVIGGYFYMTAGGSGERITAGKSIIGAALLGITLALTTLIILNQISPQFGSGANDFLSPSASYGTDCK